MLTYLPSLERIIWFAVIVSQILLSVVVRRSGSDKRYPAFATYVYFATLKSFVLLYVSMRMEPSAYFWAYYCASFFACLLIMPAIFEIFLLVYGPPRALPPHTWRKVLTFLSAAAGSWIAIAAVLQANKGSVVVRWMETTERTMIAIGAASLWVLLLYSLKLGISWRSRSASTAMGFVLFLTINLVAAFIRGEDNLAAARAARLCGQLAYLSVLAFWCVVFWEKVTSPVRLSGNELAVLDNDMSKVEAQYHGEGYKENR